MQSVIILIGGGGGGDASRRRFVSHDKERLAASEDQPRQVTFVNGATFGGGAKLRQA